MKKEAKRLVGKFGEALKENSQTGFTALAIVGACSAFGLAIDATVKATKLVEAEEERLQRKLTKAEIVGLCWKFYARGLAMVGVTIVSAIASNEINLRKNAILAAALEGSRDVIGTKSTGSETIDKVLDKDQKLVEMKDIEDSKALVDEGAYEFYEPHCGVFFKTSLANLYKANVEMSNMTEVTMEDFYYALGCMEDIPVSSRYLEWDRLPKVSPGEAFDHDGHLAIRVEFDREPMHVTD